jgi:hypothetical protein
MVLGRWIGGPAPTSTRFVWRVGHNICLCDRERYDRCGRRVDVRRSSLMWGSDWVVGCEQCLPCSQFSTGSRSRPSTACRPPSPVRTRAPLPFALLSLLLRRLPVTVAITTDIWRAPDNERLPLRLLVPHVDEGDRYIVSCVEDSRCSWASTVSRATAPCTSMRLLHASTSYL